jgi:CDP-diacylglycerol--serine O-phosphatidyltransferase
MAFVYTACASLRLARFNVSAGRYHGRFDGMPTPAGAGMVVSAVWFNDFLVGLGWGIDFPSLLLAFGVMGLGLLMVSPIPYHSFKHVRFGQSYSATVIPVIVSILLIVQWKLNFFLVGLAYVISGPAGYVWRWRTGGVLEPMRDTNPFGDATTEDTDHDEDVADEQSPAASPNVTPIATRRAAGESNEGDSAK